MRRALLSVGLSLLATASSARAENEPLILEIPAKEQPLILTVARPHWIQPNCPPAPYPMMPVDPSMLPDPKKDPKADPNVPAPQPNDNFAGATETGTQPGAMFNPNVFGDFIGIAARRRLNVGQFINQQTSTTSFITTTTNIATTTVTAVNGPFGAPPTFITTVTNTPVSTSTPVTSTTNNRIPVLTPIDGIPLAGRYQGVKVAENESPRPVDRVYFNYNGYSEVSRSILPAGFPNLDLQVQTLGFERTFLQGDASFGMRLPFVQLNGFDGVDAHMAGDLSLLFKYAWINNPRTGNVFSTGLVVTLPSGGNYDIVLADGSQVPGATLFQPWAGWIFNLPRGFLQGFSSIIVPTDSRDPTIMFNSIAAGWWLYRGDGSGMINGFVPIAELHLNTPLNHDTTDDAIFFKDQLNLTLGAYAILQRMTIGGAASIPLVGPRPFDVEGIVSVNFRY